MEWTTNAPTEGMCWVGPAAMENWLDYQQNVQDVQDLHVVLLTHPRDEQDLPRLFPWSTQLSAKERRILTKCLTPIFGEIIKTPRLNAGILFLPMYADEITNPTTQTACRKLLAEEGLQTASKAGARIVCLGGLTGTLSLYGLRLRKTAENLGLNLTTGHSLTVVSVLRTYLRAVKDFDLEPSRSCMAILGVGSVGGAVAQLLVRQPMQPRSLILIDIPARKEHLQSIARQLQEQTDIDIAIELTSGEGELSADSSCYTSSYLITTVSTANIIDIESIAPGTVLIDDSQPHCWSRERAWQRCLQRADIVPCEAGLIDCASIGYRSQFPFDFADQDARGTSSTSWSCLAEGLLRIVEPSLPPTVGEPTIDNLIRYNEAFEKVGFKIPPLQCGAHRLPVDVFRQYFSELQLKEAL